MEAWDTVEVQTERGKLAYVAKWAFIGVEVPEEDGRVLYIFSDYGVARVPWCGAWVALYGFGEVFVGETLEALAWEVLQDEMERKEVPALKKAFEMLRSGSPDVKVYALTWEQAKNWKGATARMV